MITAPSAGDGKSPGAMMSVVAQAGPCTARVARMAPRHRAQQSDQHASFEAFTEDAPGHVYFLANSCRPAYEQDG